MLSIRYSREPNSRIIRVACVVRYTGRSVDEAHRDAENHDIGTVSEPNDAFDLVILPVGLQFCG